MAQTRRELQQRYSVFILSGDTGFTDPTTSSGQLNAMYQDFRGMDENRNKAHQVLRGKKDTVRLGYWPGGPIPFGFDLQTDPIVDSSRRGRPPSKLIVNESEAVTIRRLFERARETNHGAGKLAKFLNEDRHIAGEQKPFFSSTIDFYLKNPLYVGVYVFNKYCLDIVNDIRVRERNNDSELLIKEDFCEPIILKELFDEVQALRIRRKRPANSENPTLIANKAILPPTSVKYFLVGLARCGHCNASMVPTSGKKGQKELKVYSYYRCPRHIDGNCKNSRNVPIGWMDEAVIGELSRSLFPNTFNPKEAESKDHSKQKFVTSDFELCPETEELIFAVQEHLERLQKSSESPISVLQKQVLENEDKLQGWMKTTSDPNLSIDIRNRLVRMMNEVSESTMALKDRIEELSRIATQKTIVCNRDMIINRIRRLSEVIAVGSPSHLNIELSLHIDSIRCNSDGTVILRICQLGAFGEVTKLLNELEEPTVPQLRAESDFKVAPRRRSAIRIYGENENELADMAEFAADPHRFARIGEQRFTEKKFMIPEQVGWAEKNATAVAERRKQGLTVDALATEFEVTPPTIRSALKIAAVDDDELKSLPRKMARARWHEDHADEAFRLYQSGSSMDELAGRFRKCTETVRKAIAIGKRRSSENQS